MANPMFEGFSLQDDTYITEQVNYRTRAKRRLQTEEIARRIGNKLINSQIQEKVIEITGMIVASTSSGLQSAVDDLQQNLSIVEGDLVIDDGRTFVATCESLNIPDRRFTQTHVRFEAQFVCSQPFATGNQLSGGFVIPSGINSLTISTTISGTVTNRPTLTLVLPSGTGVSPIVEVDVQHVQTANTVTVSGTLNYTNDLVFNYDAFTVSEAGTTKDYVGQFDNLGPGSTSLTVTVSGQNDGIRGLLEYNPRYW